MGAPVGVGGDLGGQRLGAGVDGAPDGVGGAAVAASGAVRRGIERGGGGGGGCCRRMVPSSLAAKINKLNVRSGLYKLVGEFGLRENLYYGSIFLCMTLIVIVCFLVINNRSSDHLNGATAAMYDSGKDINQNATNKYKVAELRLFFAFQKSNVSFSSTRCTARSTRRAAS